ncbi:major facilitator superfamily transporter [Hypoxylon trugodes]|uniref:major facilitator superfamily transporter n=1 Tax=Hypoxylon trugodes TaxID=326681 RepID=UPI00218F9114|nr:major facilitator superfamily transporter [Hypoxylon trugodes]KAI1389018.1 major facilitator superfamily transporter [Hypoxylon trugodes]
MSSLDVPSNGPGPQLQRQATNVSRRFDGGLSHFAELVQSISNQDAEARYKEEEADNRIPTDDDVPGSNESQENDGKTIISWEPNDKENPYNWPQWRKTLIVITSMMTVANSTMGSSLPSMAIPYMMAEWGVTAQIQSVLPISTYLMGYVFGPMIWGPMSEYVGRRNLSTASFLMFIIWTMACALAPNWPAMLVFRFFCGVCASAPIAVVTGILADIFNDPITRGRAMAWFMATTVFGPLLAPIISGFCSTSIGWRWTFWVGLMFAGATLVLALFLPETYAPVLLTKRAVKIRKADPKAQVYSAWELEANDFKQLFTRVLTRPIRMILTELIVTATCLYLSLVYAIFYMSFQAFPIIFSNVYGLSPGITGLCYLPVGAGAVLAVPIFFAYDRVLLNAKARGSAWAQKEEFRRVPLATLGGPLFVISLFWLGWSSRPGVPFVVPMLAGIPFGGGFMLIFMALLNYITDAYEIFAASANAAASSCRSVFAVVLPLATKPMFARLGIDGACSLLGGLSLLMCVIPFIFIWKGEEIRARSKFCIALKERKAEMERRAAEQQRRRARDAAANGALEKETEV